MDAILKSVADFLGGATVKIVIIALAVILTISAGVAAVSSYKSAISRLASVEVVKAEQDKTIENYGKRIKSLEDYYKRRNTLISTTSKKVRQTMEKEAKIDEEGNIAPDDPILAELNGMFDSDRGEDGGNSNAGDAELQP